MLRINPVDQTVGEFVRKIRDASGESRNALAAKLGVLPEQVEMWETGYARIPADLFLKLSGLLSVKPMSFFSGFHNHEELAADSGESALPASEHLASPELAQQVRMVIALRSMRNAALRELFVGLAETIAAASQANSTDKGAEAPISRRPLG